MGCCGGRPKLDANETAITLGEDQLGWGKRNTSDLCMHFKRFSDGTKLDYDAAKSAQKHAKVNIVAIVEDITALTKF